METKNGDLHKIIDESYRRLIYIEQVSKDIDRKMNLRLLKWDSSITESEQILKAEQEKLNYLEKEFKINVNKFLTMVEDFKDAATIEDFEKLKHKLDRWEPEQIVTVKEIRKITLEAVEEDL